MLIIYANNRLYKDIFIKTYKKGGEQMPEKVNYREPERIEKLVKEKEKRNEYINGYIKEKYERLQVLVEPGTKERITNRCRAMGSISASAYIKRLIENDLFCWETDLQEKTTE